MSNINATSNSEFERQEWKCAIKKEKEGFNVYRDKRGRVKGQKYVNIRGIEKAQIRMGPDCK